VIYTAFIKNILRKVREAILWEEVFLMAKIGVEQSLTNISEALRQRGHEVVELKRESDAKDCSCCVVSGLDSNVMGMQDTFTNASVIDANGLSADEVCQQVEEKLR
jgi:Asp-tRNA(Asn)/Glu-tRNA(Gln) amidotransferase A subunit family amidase